MALYDGFFDAAPVSDESGSSTGEYDREYDSGAFVDYFSAFIGSGVCVYQNPDSFLVRFEGEAAVISPGYLFINGYWLRNDADYTVPVSGNGTVYIAARLNSGERRIDIETLSAAAPQPDTLILSAVKPAEATAQDTRYNSDICGVIDSASNLTGKTQYAIDYIDNQIEKRLEEVEKGFKAQSDEIDQNVAKVQVVAERLSPLPVGSIKFSVKNTLGAKWLQCNGATFSSSTYPALYSALGTTKLPSLSLGDVPAYIKAQEG